MLESESVDPWRAVEEKKKRRRRAAVSMVTRRKGKNTVLYKYALHGLPSAIHEVDTMKAWTGKQHIPCLGRTNQLSEQNCTTLAPKSGLIF